MFKKLVIAIVIILMGGLGPAIAETPGNSPNLESVAAQGAPTSENEGGADLQRRFFADLHQPYGTVLPRSELHRIYDDLAVQAKKSTTEVTSWEFVGPNGIPNGAGGFYTGRVLDLDIQNSSTLRFAAASGGFWTHETVVIFPFPVRLSDDLPTQAFGAFSTDPWEEDFILVGSGEAGIRGGTGLYLTDDGGQRWFGISMNPEPAAFYRIRHDSDNPYIVYAATTEGFYKSNDRGLTWTRTLTGIVTDFVINPWNHETLHTVVENVGYFRSEDSGATWTQHTTGLPTSFVGRGAIAIAPGLPSRVYAAFVRKEANAPSVLLGVYKSVDAGTTWTNITPANYMGGQGWYNNVLSVDPNDEDILFAGGVKLMKTTNAGTTWSEVVDSDLHPDYHALSWANDGTHFYAGHDGGISISADRGLTWSSASNLYPITQYYHLDTYPTSTSVVGGGTQDNGTTWTTDGGSTWAMLGGDGGGFAVNPHDASEWWMTLGVFDGDWAFERFHTTNAGTNWNPVNGGIPASTNWFPQIRHDHGDPGLMFTNAAGDDIGGAGVFGSKVLASADGGASWSNYYGSLFTRSISDLTTTPWNINNGRAVYACLSGASTGNRLWVCDDGLWHERSAGLPSGYAVRRVVPDPNHSNRAYALMQGLGNVGAKIFFSTNRGVSWTNVTGDLPDVPVTDLVVDPTDDQTLIVSSEFGCFRSTTGGASWEVWNNGLPKGAIVLDLAIEDLGGSFGGYWIVAGTFGHSVWRREISGEDVDHGIFSDGFESGDTTLWSASNPS